MRYLLCFFAFFSGGILYGRTVRYYAVELGIREDRRDRVLLGGFFLASCAACLSNTGLIPLSFTFLLLLVLITWIDFRKKIIPNRLNAAILLLGAVRQAARLAAGHGGLSVLTSRMMGGLAGAPGLKECLAGLLIISIPVILINRAFPGGLGGGDVKLLAASGFYLGWKGVLQGAAAGSLLAAAVCLVLLFMHRLTLRDKIAFGPYLCVGMAAAALVGG